MAKKAASKPKDTAKKKAVRAKKPKASADPAVPEVAKSHADNMPGVPVVMGAPVHVDPEFDIFNPAARERAERLVMELQHKADESQSTKKPRPGVFRTADKAKLLMWPFSSIVRQFICGSWGRPRNGVTMVVGDEGTGKSTLALCDAAHIMLNSHARVLILECEGKPMTSDRMLQCMHTDPVKAHAMLVNVTMDDGESLDQLIPKTERWLEMQRKGVKGPKGTWLVKPLPKEIPLHVIWDPISRLLTKAQAQGIVEWDTNAAGKKAEVGAGTNLGHSQYLAACSRVLPPMLKRHNASLTMVFSPSVKLSMNQHAAKMLQQMSEWKRTLTEMTWIGGKAPRGLVSQTLLMTVSSYITGPDKKTIVGKEIRVQGRKASHGQDGRFGKWVLDTVPIKAKAKFLPPPIQYGPGLEEMFAYAPQFGYSVDAKTGLAKLPKFNLAGLRPQQIHAAIHSNPAWVKEIGEALGITGYVHMVEDLNSGNFEEVDETEPVQLTAKEAEITGLTEPDDEVTDFSDDDAGDDEGLGGEDDT